MTLSVVHGNIQRVFSSYRRLMKKNPEDRQLLQVRISRAIWQEMREHCVKVNMTYSALVEKLLKAFLAGPSSKK